MDEFKVKFNALFSTVEKTFRELTGLDKGTPEITPEHVKLCNELYEMSNLAKPQSEEVLVELMFLYADLFKSKCGSVPNFTIINNKGQPELIEN